MKTFFEHIEHVKEKPHHVRKRIAFATAAFGALLIALIWFIGSLSMGTFAIRGATFADSTGQGSIDTSTASSRPIDSGVAGAAAAVSNDSVPVHIEIIDTSSPASKTKRAEQTTIPF